MVEWLRQRYLDGIQVAQITGLSLIYQSATNHVMPGDQAEEQADRVIHAAKARLAFLDETVVPYLGTAGPTGRIADMQLRLLVDEHRGAVGYQDEWRP